MEKSSSRTLASPLLSGHWLPWWLSGKRSACQSRKHRFGLWVKKIPWSRKRQPTPVLFPGKSHKQRSLVGYSLWGHRVRHDWATKQQQHLRTLLTIQKSVSPKRCWLNPGNAREIRMKAGVWAPQRVTQVFMLLTCSPLLGQAELYPEANASLQDGETHQASPGQEKHLFSSLAIQI